MTPNGDTVLFIVNVCFAIMFSLAVLYLFREARRKVRILIETEKDWRNRHGVGNSLLDDQDGTAHFHEHGD